MSTEAKPNRIIDGISQPLEVSAEVARHMTSTFRRLIEAKRKEGLPKELRELSTSQINYHDSVDQV